MRLAFLAVPLIVLAAAPGIVDEVRQALAQNNLALAEASVQKYRSQNGTTPETLEALSWLGRGALALNQLDKAGGYAKQTQQLADVELKKRALDAEPHLPLALGAAIEVQALVMAQRGERNEAVYFLRQQLVSYGNTSVQTRIQKNINLLSLEGKPAPALQSAEFLGPKPPSLASLKGRPVLLFFWAHWCGDCKGDEPLIARLRAEYASQGLVVVGPTQRYGYAARGEEASPAQELKYIDEVRRQFYRDLLDMPAPVSEQNFKNYGASTTPTLVFIDKQGIVRLYHPGKMTWEELRAAMDRVVNPSAESPRSTTSSRSPSFATDPRAAARATHQ
jgi:thiol-disulfide isomerase/thioredoxin